MELHQVGAHMHSSVELLKLLPTAFLVPIEPQSVCLRKAWLPCDRVLTLAALHVLIQPTCLLAPLETQSVKSDDDKLDIEKATLVLDSRTVERCELARAQQPLWDM